MGETKSGYLWDQNNPTGYFNRMGFYKTKVELDFILTHVLKKDSHILDLGGGSGRFAIPLMKLGHDVTVVDLDNDAIQLCKARGVEKAYCNDIRNINLPLFDVVLAIELFLVTTPQDVMNVVNNQLKENGIFIFVATNKLSWRYKLHSLRKKKTKNLGEFSLSEYKDMITNKGFEIIDIKGFNWMPFRVNSNSILIPFFTLIESLFRLNKWLGQSPWLLFACRKID